MEWLKWIIEYWEVITTVILGLITRAIERKGLIEKLTRKPD